MTKSKSDTIAELERKFWQTMVDKDAAAASAVMSPTCHLSGAQG